MQRTTKLLGATLAACIATAACSNESVNPATKTLADPLFERYVSMGNSLTAGFQSGGINDSTQLQGYPVLLSQQMGTVFFDPLMNRPGCPAPYINVFAGTRVGGATAPPCALRATQAVAPPYINNTAVPGAAVIDPTSNLDPLANANALTTFFLGGLTQVEMMQKVNPTFVTVWIGNNDVLGAATDPVNAGDTTEVTPQNVFQTDYNKILDAIDQTPAKGKGVLIGVADVAAIPYFTSGVVYFALAQGGRLPPKMTVSLDCAPMSLGGIGDTTLVPFQFGATLLGEANAGVADTLDCLDDHNIEPAELAYLHSAVAGYNTFIAAQAASLGYVFLDPNPALLALKADTSKVAVFPKFPPDPANTTAPFGTAFSRDGVHPSATTHKLIANVLIQLVDSAYGKTLPQIP
ncbi:MAG TPA: SGNH/GDSL hydrolase family protein [Gemmatimonadales bacterium]|nr:SGNH/GDSL hydrolase family protein [Gemmatimonadales bacterium]